MTFDHKNKGMSIRNSMKINGQPPAEADMQKYFNVTAPSVHRMIVELEKKELIYRERKKTRSLSIRVNLEQLPQLI